MNDTNITPEIFGKVNLSVFANSEWFVDPNKSKFWLRIYTLIGVKKDDVFEIFKNAIRNLHYEIPIQIKYGFIGETDLPKWGQHLVSGENGNPHIILKQGTETFPCSTCVFISMPFINDGECVGLEKVTSALSLIPNLIISHMGKNTLRDIVFDGSVSCADGSFSPLGTVTNIPKPFDGPAVQEFLWKAIKETVDKLNNSSIEVKERVELAFEIYEKGIAEYTNDARKSDAFLFYWMAMEVLAGGEGKIETSLQNHYKMKGRMEVRKVLGTENIRNWRNDMVHDGKRPPVTPYVERYMQLMFLDILRFRIRTKLCQPSL